MVAGDLRPSNVPLIVSLFPESSAVTEPRPATVLAMAVVIGTGDRRALKVFVLCARRRPAGAALHAASTAHAIAILRVICPSLRLTEGPMLSSGRTFGLDR